LSQVFLARASRLLMAVSCGLPGISLLIVLVMPVPLASQSPMPELDAAFPDLEAQASVPTAPPAPKVYMAPNPPSCALEFTNIMYHLTKVAVDITLETKTCAWNMGWLGQTPFGDKQQWPFHKERACTVLVLQTISLVGAVVGDIEAIMFDCFDHNQACGQAIAHAAQFLIDSANALVVAASVCEPPGADAPFYSVHDVPVKGFICWATIWHSIQRILKASKFIDVALLSCDQTPSPIPDEVAPPAPVPDEEIDGESENSTSLGASWNQLGPQAVPFRTMGLEIPDVAPEERRLSLEGSTMGAKEQDEASESEADAAPDVEWKRVSLVQAKERIVRILDALGYDGVMEELEPVQDVEQVKHLVMSFVGSPPANSDASPDIATSGDNVSKLGVNDTYAVWV